MKEISWPDVCYWPDFTGKEIPWLGMEFLVILPAGFLWEINTMDGGRISDNHTVWISFGNNSHGWTWNFWQFYWLDFSGEISPMAGCELSSNATGWIPMGNTSHCWTWNFWYCCWLDFSGK